MASLKDEFADHYQPFVVKDAGARDEPIPGLARLQFVVSGP